MEKPIYFNLNDKIGGNTLKGYKLYINADKVSYNNYINIYKYILFIDYRIILYICLLINCL